jgi:hypothetical protein
MELTACQLVKGESEEQSSLLLPTYVIVGARIAQSV